MFGLLFGFIWRICRQILSALFLWTLGILISAALRLGAILLRLSVFLTGWILAYADIRLDGRLSRRTAAMYISAGGLWALIGFLVPLVLALLIGDQPSISMRLTALGFLYGLYCAWRVRRMPGWGVWAADDGLPLGESARW